MKLTVLGACGVFPSAGGATSGYLLELGGRHILIDCGSGVAVNLFRYIKLEDLDGIILTHWHTDHVCDMPIIRQAIEFYRNSGRDLPAIPVIAPAMPEMASAGLQGDGVLIIGQIVPGNIMNLFGAQVRFYAMDHPVETYGVAIELDGRKFAYTADTVPCTNLQPLLQDADLALMDAGSLERLRGGKILHMTAEECAVLARACQVKRLLLTHILPFVDPQEVLSEASAQYPGAEIARALEVYEI
jgi:ribonuclease BN (tRNA processing enzyme)